MMIVVEKLKVYCYDRDFANIKAFKNSPVIEIIMVYFYSFM